MVMLVGRRLSIQSQVLASNDCPLKQLKHHRPFKSIHLEVPGLTFGELLRLFILDGETVGATIFFFLLLNILWVGTT